MITEDCDTNNSSVLQDMVCHEADLNRLIHLSVILVRRQFYSVLEVCVYELHARVSTRCFVEVPT
jgi:hypothetical protein